MKNLLLRALPLLVAVPFAQAQNDECTGAVGIGLGFTAFDTTAATPSAPGWPCAGGGGPDVWYSFVAPNTAIYSFNTCTGTNYDSALELFSGPCNALVSVACNDDACALQSGLSVNANAGDSYFLRIGGFAGGTGTGMLEVTEFIPPPPPPGTCLTTLFGGNNQGSVGGGIYFEITAASAIDIGGLQANFTATAGTSVGMEVYMAPSGTPHTGAGWVLVGMDDGNAQAAGIELPTNIILANPIPVAAGQHAVALVAVNTAHRYTNGTGTNQSYTDGTLTMDLGSASNVPFTGGLFSPRVWNGSICYTGGSPPPLGMTTTDCPAVPHSVGGPANVALFGSGNAGTEIFGTVSNGPPGEFGYFITGPNPGIIPAGCGSVCIGTPQFRYDNVAMIYQFDGAGNSQAIMGGGPVVLPGDGSYAPVPMIMIGETRRFQGWFRDAGCTMPGQAYNFTDIVSHMFN